MRFIFFSICLAFLAATSVQSLKTGVYSSASCNDWVDKMLLHMRPLSIEKNADPLTLPDMDLPFNYTFLFMDHQGWLNLSDGFAIGMSTVERGGDCFINYDFQMLRLELQLLVNDITIDAKHSTHVMGMEPAGNLLASLQTVPIIIHILVDVKESTVSLQHFEIPSVKDMKISMDGLGILGDALLAIVLAIVDNLFKTKVIGALSDEIKTIITQILDGIHYLPPIPTSTPAPLLFNRNGMF